MSITQSLQHQQTFSLSKGLPGAVMGACGYGVGLGAVLAPGLIGRRLFAQAVKLVGGAGLRMAPWIYNSLDAENHEFSTGERKRRPIRQRRQFAALLADVDAGKIEADDAFGQLDISEEACAEAETLSAYRLFASIDPNAEVAVEYSGGGASTLAALLAALYFRRVHLITGHHAFTSHRDRSAVNAQKLSALFGPDKIRHVYVDTNRALDEMFFGNYWQDLRRYGTLPAAVGCLACKLSFDVGTIKYAKQHGLGAVLDGSNLMIKFQISQGHPEIMRERERMYDAHGLAFLHPCASLTDAATTLLLLGRKLHPSVLLYPVQPDCRGYDFLSQITTRFHFLHRYGMDGLSELGQRYSRDKLAVCDALIGSSRCECPTSEADCCAGCPQQQ